MGDGGIYQRTINDQSHARRFEIDRGIQEIEKFRTENKVLENIGRNENAGA
jgi:hypothetical protein